MRLILTLKNLGNDAWAACGAGPWYQAYDAIEAFITLDPVCDKIRDEMQHQ